MLGSKGFTLLEVLIAITLLAFITLGVVSVTDNAILTKERTTQMNKDNLAIESALSRFDWDFGQIYSPLYFSSVLNMQSNIQNTEATDPNVPPESAQNKPQVSPELQMYYEQIIERMQRNEHFSALSQEGLPIPRFYSPEINVFEFLTSSNRRKMENMKQSTFAWVRYGLSDSIPGENTENENAEIPKNLKNLTRWFDPNDPWGTTRINLETTKGAVLLKNVEALEFHFWDFQKKKWERNLRTIQNGENIIRGVKIFISWYDSQGIKRTAERVFRNHWPMVVNQDQATTPPGSRPPATPDGQSKPSDTEEGEDIE